MTATTALDATLVALADPSRRGAIDLLRRKPRRAGELAEELGLSAPAMSRHLRVLRSSGLVERAFDADDARATIYRLRPERLVQLRHWLDEIERFWSLQLDGFARHVEATRGRHVEATRGQHVEATRGQHVEATRGRHVGGTRGKPRGSR